MYERYKPSHAMRPNMKKKMEQKNLISSAVVNINKKKSIHDKES